MKIKDNINLADFFEHISQCSSKVTFKSAGGDILVLQSTFCQYIFASQYSHQEFLKNGDIICEDESDYEMIQDFIA